MPPADVCAIINQSECGLVPSEEEGGCFASSEHLMCGIPVVSTPSRGGRDVFYDAGNSSIVEPSEADVARGVNEVIGRRLDPHGISQRHLARVNEFRATFLREVLPDALTEIGSDATPSDVLASSFTHTMIDWLQPRAARALLRSSGRSAA